MGDESLLNQDHGSFSPKFVLQFGGDALQGRGGCFDNAEGDDGDSWFRSFSFRVKIITAYFFCA